MLPWSLPLEREELSDVCLPAGEQCDEVFDNDEQLISERDATGAVWVVSADWRVSVILMSSESAAGVLAGF